MVSSFWCLTFLVCVIIETNGINAREIAPEDRSIIGNLFRQGAGWKFQIADKIDDAFGQLRGLLENGGSSLISNLRVIAEAASNGMQNSDTAVKNGLEAAKDAAHTSYLAGRAVPKVAIDLATVGMKSLEDLISSQQEKRIKEGLLDNN